MSGDRSNLSRVQKCRRSGQGSPVERVDKEGVSAGQLEGGHSTGCGEKTHVSLLGNIHQCVLLTFHMGHLRRSRQTSAFPAAPEQKATNHTTGQLAGHRSHEEAKQGETHITVVRRGSQILVFLVGEDVNTHKVALCMAVLSSL